MIHTAMQRAGLAAATVVAVLLALVACGGGGVGSNGTGSPVVPGLSVGTVSGLGSVIVDGIRYDDSAAAVEIRRNTTQPEVGDVQLGHRVSLEFGTDTAGARVLQRVELLPAVLGRVHERTADTLGVLGQTVTVNTDPARGPVTVFEAPLGGLADVRLGDGVEVHGLALRTGSGVRDVRLVASRIAARTSLSGVRVSGMVADLSTTGGSGARRFQLGGLSVELPATATVLPAGRALENGLAVTVFGAEAAFDPDALTLRAGQVQVMAVGDTGATLQRAGLLGGMSGTGFDLDGVAVLVGAVTLAINVYFW